MLHGYRQLYNLHRNRRHLLRHVKTRFDTSNYTVGRLLSKGKDKKVIELKKHGLGRKTMTEFVVLRPKSYSYLTDDKNIKLEKQNMYHKKRT